MTADRRALAAQRGAQLASKVKLLGPGRFMVASSTLADTHYVVTRTVPVEGFPTYACTCTAGRYGHICQHSEAARQWFERPAEPVAETEKPLGGHPSTRGAMKKVELL